MCVYIYIHTHTSLSLYIYIYIYVYTNVCMHVEAVEGPDGGALLPVLLGSPAAPEQGDILM